MRKSVVALSVLAAAAAVPAQAEYLYGFGNVYADYLTWTNGTQGFDKQDVSDARDDHITIGAEGGAGFTWGEIYGFYEYEKVDRASSERGQAAKFSMHYKVAGNVTAYGQIYDLSQSGAGGAFDEQNRVLGMGYVGLTGDNYWFKPWVGVHDVTTGTGEAAGMNGGMFGWSAGYSFEIAGQPLLVTNWNEIEFARNDAYTEMQNGSTGLNGGLSLTYDITDTIYTSLTYRYFANKLGVDGYGDAAIFRIGMHL
ncbi:outer membrane protein OmpK [Enterovibrio coralii]|uniref:Porin n=1 Tax=Enterovibrio coralii TaxID=294935 RepID=A0A135I2Z9_9GAMM|nr:outer membrane protein OmpK [Enterovibrio coralii]KXF79801.1 hypothetical protein ATN88_12965 [Enterovibrio coralii]